MVLGNPSNATESLDRLAEELQRYRIDAGDVSYSEIATRIAKRREAGGKSPAEARIARSTIYAAFSAGRQRVNADLVSEIILALGGDETEAAAWRVRCLRARSAVALGAPSPAPSLPSPRSIHPGIIILLIVACVGLNQFGNAVTLKFQLPLFLDMAGTALAAFTLGPWYGALVGAISSTASGIAGDPVSIAFAAVNVAGALVWGYGVRYWRMDRSPLRFFALNIVVALVCTLVAVPVNVLFFGGVAGGHVYGSFVTALVAVGQGVWFAVFSVNLAISVADKLIAGYLALFLHRLLVRLGASTDRAATQLDRPWPKGTS